MGITFTQLINVPKGNLYLQYYNQLAVHFIMRFLFRNNIHRTEHHYLSTLDPCVHTKDILQSVYLLFTNNRTEHYFILT